LGLAPHAGDLVHAFVPVAAAALAAGVNRRFLMALASLVDAQLE